MYADAEQIAVEIVRDFTAATTVVKIPNPRPASFVLIRRTGGPRLNIVADQPQLTVEAWAATDVEAHDLAQLARAAFHQARGSVVDGTTVYRIDELSGPANLPDPVSDQSRYTFSVSIGMRGDDTADPVSA